MQVEHAARRVLLASTFVPLALLLVLGCGSGQTRPDAASAKAEAADVERFEVRPIALRRGPGLLLRTDTATGQAWTMGVMDAPKWKPLREGEAGVPTPDGRVSGRYGIKAIKANRGAPTLVRTDGATGRIWRKGASSAGPWVPVPNPDPSLLVEPEPTPTASDEPAVAAPEAAPGSNAGASAAPAEEAAPR